MRSLGVFLLALSALINLCLSAWCFICGDLKLGVVFCAPVLVCAILCGWSLKELDN